MSPDLLAASIKQKALDLGFDLCGIAAAVPSSFKPQFLDWLSKDFHGEMGYLARDPDRRTDPGLVLEGCKSIVVVAMNYYTESDADIDDPERAIFARYARGDDYHEVMGSRLKELLTFIKELVPFVPEVPHVPTTGKVYVDTGPLLEREIAQRAGIGWFGKNTMLINTRKGSWFLLGEILLNLELPVDDPAVGGCGTCRKCLDACPTGAIVRPFEVDARRCISYLTIELKGAIPEELSGKIGNRVFGCDICQEVCPFNVRRAVSTDEPAFQPRDAVVGRTLGELAEMSEEEFRVTFKGSPVNRAKWRGLMRNGIAALAVSDDPAAEAALLGALDHP